MKKIILFALLCSVMAVNARQQGALSGQFTINSIGDKVYFSQGNLQYQASTDTWRFAEHQTDYIGEVNLNRSDSYSGWIDLFTFGSSGAESNMQPYSDHSLRDKDITGTAYDWGIYNAISNGGNEKGLWRTMTYDEWKYMLDKRADATLLRSQATVNGMAGYILLPDAWQLPAGMSFTPMANDFTTNTYTATQWQQLEAAGAVFLPAAGCIRTDFGDIFYYSGGGSTGYYWTSSTESREMIATYSFTFSKTGADIYSLPLLDYAATCFTSSVRLITVANPYASEKKLQGKFTVADGKEVVFSQGNLQYNAVADKWQFAEDQWEVIGNANKNISPAYNGWIDLFGWGTSGFANKNPYMTSSNDEDYADGSTDDIADTYFDWGKYNAIENGGKEEGQWRTMTNAEWEYLLRERANADKLQGVATVNYVYGYVLLPDNWELPDKMWFKALATTYNSNIYTPQQWAQMEAAGAVFLPMGGYRDGQTVEEVNRYADYWTSTADPEDVMQAGEVYFGIDKMQMTVDWSPGKSFGYNVRLVQEARSTGIESVSAQTSPSQAQKVMIDGQVYILRDGKAFTILGTEAK